MHPIINVMAEKTHSNNTSRRTATVSMNLLGSQYDQPAARTFSDGRATKSRMRSAPCFEDPAQLHSLSFDDRGRFARRSDALPRRGRGKASRICNVNEIGITASCSVKRVMAADVQTLFRLSPTDKSTFKTTFKIERWNKRCSANSGLTGWRASRPRPGQATMP